MKKTACLILLVLVSLRIIPCGTAAAASGKLTVMIYMCGSNLESGYGSASADLQEIFAACADNPDLTVLVMAGGSSGWVTQYSPNELTLVEIRGRRQRVVRRLPAMSMGLSEPLTTLLQLGPGLCPADRYALILWNHGGGPLEGVCYDERYGMDRLSIRELSDALAASPFSSGSRLSWIGFDACLMASVEVAGTCAPYADYMIASQETEPARGWDYAFLSSAGTDAEETGRRILACYDASQTEKDMYTLSLIRLDRIPAVEAATNAFFAEAFDALNASSFSEISRSRLNTKGFGRASTASDYDLVDLYDLAAQTAFTAPGCASALQDALADAVACAVGNQDRAHGLSVWYPFYNKEMYVREWRETYGEMDLLPDYRRYLARYDTIWNGDRLADWSGLDGRADPLTPEGTQTVEITLTEEQLLHFGSASCMILQDYGSGEIYNNIYAIEDAVLDGNTLSAAYSFEALYAVDENGVIETWPIPFVVRDGYYLIYALLGNSSVMNSAWDENSYESTSVLIRCRRNDETNALEIMDILPITGDGDTVNLGRESIVPDPETWPFISFVCIPRVKTATLSGNLLPFSNWQANRLSEFNLNVIDADGRTHSLLETSVLLSDETALPEGYHHVTEADNRRPWSLRFLPVNSAGKNLAAQFVLRDTQGNEWGSSLIPLDSPDVVAEVPLDAEWTVGDCVIRPFALKAVRNASVEGIVLRAYVENHAAVPVYTGFANPILNRFTCPENILFSTREIRSGETGIADVMIPVSALQGMDESAVHSVSVIPFIYLKESGGNTSVAGQRVSFTAELDLSGLRLPDRPDPDNDYPEADQIIFNVLHIEPAEDDLLRGQAVIVNNTSSDMQLAFYRMNEDYRAVFRVNDMQLRDCLRAPSRIDLMGGGGKCVFDFSVILPPDRTLGFLPDAEGPAERELTEITVCGFRVEVADSIDNLGDVKLKRASVTIPLDEPLVLDVPVRLVFSDGPVARQDAPEEPSPDPEDADEPPPAGTDPYPFLSETLSVPEEPQQYAVTLRYPLDADALKRLDKAVACLVLPRSDRPDLYNLLAYLDLPPYRDGDAAAMDFCGLLPFLNASGQAIPCVVYEEATGFGYGLVSPVYIAGIPGRPEDSRNQLLNEVYIALDAAAGTARLAEYTLKPFKTNYGDTHTVAFYHHLIRYDPVGPVLDLGYQGPEERGGAAEPLSGQLKLRLRPAAELQPEVIFHLEFSDGTVRIDKRSWQEAVR